MRERFWEVVGSIVGILLLIIFTVADVVGIVHAYKKHGTFDAFMALSVPPWGIWRGIESLWHDDYEDVNWDIQLSKDFETVIFFYERTLDNDVDVYLLNKEVSDFAETIKDYPSSKKDKLKRVSRAYIEYHYLAIVETISFLRSDDASSQPTWSEKFYELENEICALLPEITDIRSGFELMLNINDYNNSELNMLALKSDIMQNKLDKMFQQIFGSDK